MDNIIVILTWYREFFLFLNLDLNKLLKKFQNVNEKKNCSCRSGGRSEFDPYSSIFLNN